MMFQKAAHGGFVKIVGETSFELVALENGAEVYLKEEDEELDTAPDESSLAARRY
jgi:hypothetical protein